jgi:hypothetical protein
MEKNPVSNTSNNASWLWGSVLIVLGAAALLSQFVPWFTGLLWAGLFAGAGVVFFTIYLRNREQWWSLIPGYVFVIIGGIICLATIQFPGDFIGSFVMFSIALPFLFVYLQNREHWWFLIPAYVMTVIGVIIWLSATFSPNGDLVGVMIMWAIALPFYYVYFHNREHWWALIPAYVMTVIGIIIGATSMLHMDGEMVGAFVMFAIALPFFVVYLRNRSHWWALIPAGIMTLIGIGLFVTSSTYMKYIIPAALILIGIYLVARQSIQGSSAETQKAKSGPEADKPPSV